VIEALDELRGDRTRASDVISTGMTYTLTPTRTVTA